jgi:serine/threonine protein kinase
VQNNQISDDEVKFFFRQVVQGIGYAHANLIAHRDLKPENILIDAARVVKVVDFGLSNLMKDGRLLKTACGSPNYAAPEIVSEQKYEGTSVDVWSCGVILYALLVGHLPFSEERVSLLYRKIEGKHSATQPAATPSPKASTRWQQTSSAGCCRSTPTSASGSTRLRTIRGLDPTSPYTPEFGRA